jgi:hypothetical protein
MGKNNNNNKKNNPNGGIKGSAKSGNNNKSKNNPNGGIKGSAKAAASSKGTSASKAISNIISGGGGGVSSSNTSGGKATQTIFSILNKQNSKKDNKKDNKNNKNKNKNNSGGNKQNKSAKENNKINNLKTKINALQATIAANENAPSSLDTSVFDSYLSGIQQSINANNQSNQDMLSSLLESLNSQRSNASEAPVEYTEEPEEDFEEEEEEEKPIEPPRPTFPDIPYQEWDFNYGQKPSEETSYEYPGFPVLTNTSEKQMPSNFGETYTVDNSSFADDLKKTAAADSSLDEEEKNKLKIFEEIMNNTRSGSLAIPETFESIIVNV